MTRIRYIADKRRGPHGGHNDVRTTFSTPATASNNLRPQATRWHHGSKPEPGSRVLVVDLDELEVYGADATERYAFAERQMLRWTQIAQELKPSGELPAAPDPDSIRLMPADVRALALAAHSWLAARKEAKRKAEVDLRELLCVLLRDGKLPRDVVHEDDLLATLYQVPS